jgi:hypothetical protein
MDACVAPKPEGRATTRNDRVVAGPADGFGSSSYSAGTESRGVPRTHVTVGLAFRSVSVAVATADRETGSDLSANGLPRHLTRWSASHEKPLLEVRIRRTGPDRSSPQHTPLGRPTGWSRVWSRAVHRTYRGTSRDGAAILGGSPTSALPTRAGPSAGARARRRERARQRGHGSARPSGGAPHRPAPARCGPPHRPTRA